MRGPPVTRGAGGRPGLLGRPGASALVALWLGLLVAGALAPARAAQDAGTPAASPAATASPPATTRPARVAKPAAPKQIRLQTLREGMEPVPFWERGVSFLGLWVMVFLGWLMSTDRKRFPWRVVLWGVGLQLVFGVFVLETTAGRDLFGFLNDVVMRLLDFTNIGAKFIFGDYLNLKYSFALNVLPTIIFFSALMTVLYHLGIMQWVVKGFAWLMQRTMGTSGSETLSAAANIFVGQTEAPLVVKPFVETMTESELMAIMVGGFATVAGGVMAAYVGMLSGTFPDIAGHLIAASVMSAPAALVLAKVMIPETEASATAGSLRLEVDRPDANVIDAAARGAGEGLHLALNVGAMLLAFLALIALIDYVIELPELWHNRAAWHAVKQALTAQGLALPAGCARPDGAAAFQHCVNAGVAAGHLAPGAHTAWTPISLERILGWLFWPIAWIMGTPAHDCSAVARLLGEKLVLNEFVAYADLGKQLQHGVHLSYRAVVIATYALCGFANFGSIAIQIGGIGGIAPSRRHDLARIGLRAMIAGTLAAFMTATVAGMLI